MSPDHPHFLIATAWKLNPSIQVWARYNEGMHPHRDTSAWYEIGFPVWCEDLDYVLLPTGIDPNQQEPDSTSFGNCPRVTWA